MALGNFKEKEQNRIFLSVSHGKIVQSIGGAKKYFSYVDGCIEAVYNKRSTFGNEVVTRWYIDLRDGDDVYSLCLPYSSGVFKSIILSLASDEALSFSTPVRIEPYEGRNGYTKVVVYSDGIKLDWVVKQLPEQETVFIGGKQIRDDSKQMEFINSLCSVVLERMSKNSQM